MKNVIQFVETTPIRTPFKMEGAYSFNPKRGWLLAQRLALWTLRKIGCHHYSETTTYRRITIDREATMREIFRQQVSLRGLSQNPEVLLIGSDDFMRITAQEGPQFNPFGFDGEYWVGYTLDDGRQGTTRKRMRVCIIPWMSGMVLVPREALYRS